MLFCVVAASTDVSIHSAPEFLFFPRLCQHLLLVVLILAVPAGVR